MLNCDDERARERERKGGRVIESDRKKEEDAILWVSMPLNPVRDYVCILILFDCIFRPARASFTEKLKI